MSTVMFYVITALYTLIDILVFALVLRAILSWFIPPYNKFSILLGKLTEPLIKPFRPLAMRISQGRMPIDIAPLFSFLVLQVFRWLLQVASRFLIYM